MIPTDAQREAIVDIATTDRPITRLHGYAGTGKTSVVAAHSIGALERAGTSVQVLAPTGKAAKVLRSKGLHTAATIHSYLYAPSKRERQAWRETWESFAAAALQHDPRLAPALAEIDSAGATTDLEPVWDALIAAAPARVAEAAKSIRDAKRYELAFTAAGAIAHYEDYGRPASDVLLIDEASMVSSGIAYDLTRTGSRIVYVGDPAQLPPVKAQRSDDAMGRPHHLLTEIHRQKGGSPVLELATAIRQADVPTVPRTRAKHLTALEDYDQVLCWRNATREHVNATIRQRLGRRRRHVPEAGDRLVCLKNTKPVEGAKQWMNGEQATVLHVDWLDADEVVMTVRDDEGGVYGVTSPLEPFAGYPGEQRYLDQHSWGSADPAFTFGYALTVHKSQGSEWGRVLLVDESPILISMAARREGRQAALEQGRQWLYTGVTRASELVHVVDDIERV